MANLVVICGPQAVGKMTVAKALKEKIGYAVSINHDSLEVPAKIFGWGTPAFKEMRNVLRNTVFDLCIKDNIDLIFTYTLDFGDEEDVNKIIKRKEQFEKSGGVFYFVELETSLEERLKRNVTEDRLLEKPTKRNIERRNKELVESIDKYRMNSYEGEVSFDNYIKINNEKLSPEEVVEIIIKKFKL